MNCRRGRSCRGRCCEVQEGKKQQREVLCTAGGVEAAEGGAVNCRRGRSSRGGAMHCRRGRSSRGR